MSKTIGKLQKIKDLVEKIYLVKDPNIIDVLFAIYLTHLSKADPAWLVVVAESGGGKTEFLNLLSKAKYVHPLSTLTANTFVSGAKLSGGKPASFLTKLSAGTDQEGSGIITFKDLTSLMSEQDVTRTILMAQLREIYDGKYVKQFGTGQNVHWEGKVTIVAGSTFSIHDAKQKYVSMGERFLFYNLIQPDRHEVGMRSMNNQEKGEMSANRDNLAELSRIYLNEDLVVPEKLPEIPQELKSRMVDLAEMTTRARSDVVRDYRSQQKEIIAVHPPEMPTRFAGCLQVITQGLMMLHWNESGEMDLPEKYKKIIYKIALDSITPEKRIAMQELARYNVLETKGLALKLDRPTNTLRRHVEDLVALGIAQRERGSGNKGDRWSLKPQYKKLMREFEDIKQEAEELTENNAISEEDLLSEAEATREEEPPGPDAFDL